MEKIGADRQAKVALFLKCLKSWNRYDRAVVKYLDWAENLGVTWEDPRNLGYEHLKTAISGQPSIRKLPGKKSRAVMLPSALVVKNTI